MPNGCAIFHGLDNKISDADFDAISETHPQYSFKKLFIGSDISLKDVKNLVETKEGARLNLLKEALRPPSSVYKWKESDISNEALNNLYRIDCPDIDYEADIISLILRKTLEEEGKRAVVVTPNRNLARIIKSKMLKWDIFLDDSSGYPLTISKIGMFFDLISNYALNQNDHVALLELLKHPFTIAGFDFENSIKNTRKLERKYLRGLIKKLSIDEVIELIKEDDLKAWLNDVKQILSPFLDIFKKERFDFETVLKNHIKVAEKLASTLDTPLNLWRKNEGKVCADLMFKVLESAKMVGEINLKEYQEFIDLILSGETIRPLYGMHPRLDILSPIESRLQKSDVVVIAGLNDDNWVNSNGYNPWINQNMKKTLSLLSEDFEIGVSALDFLNQASNGKVYLTRSLKEGGALKNPSRWLLRLDAVMEIKGLKYNLLDEDFDCYVKSFYEVDEKITINAPKPTLPINFKPSELSLSDLKLLWHDAYAIYAKHGLKLKPLDDIEIEIGAREFGIVVHEVLSKSLNKTYNEILEIGTLALKEYGFDGGYWFQKFENYAKFFYEKVMEEKNLVDRSYCEVKGEAKLNDIKIKARADRIDVLNDKTLRLIDYKTSSKDLKKEALKGYEPQLVLEAMMAREGCFENVPPHNVSKIEYWQVDFENGGKIDDFEAVGRKKEPIDKDALIEDYRDRTIALLEYYKREDAIYLSKRTGEEIYSDYDHLARVEEWMISGDDNNE
ncbi:MAG: ATP-dependent helicase/deoxyribonuclease subunit B [Alphaproteobacteria bacterium ADurb.Bin438]|nr:MAG: ATP-dependent helicase/deoxyribonuclease subunit B [Alphaproteobacteria bacterium ADurb.Bin438]